MGDVIINHSYFLVLNDSAKEHWAHFFFFLSSFFFEQKCKIGHIKTLKYLELFKGQSCSGCMLSLDDNMPRASNETDLMRLIQNTQWFQYVGL